MARIKEDSNSESSKELDYAFSATYASFFLSMIFVLMFQNEYREFYKNNPEVDQFKPDSYLYICVAIQGIAFIFIYLLIKYLFTIYFILFLNFTILSLFYV